MLLFRTVFYVHSPLKQVLANSLLRCTVTAITRGTIGFFAAYFLTVYGSAEWIPRAKHRVGGRLWIWFWSRLVCCRRICRVGAWLVSWLFSRLVCCKRIHRCWSRLISRRIRYWNICWIGHRFWSWLNSRRIRLRGDGLRSHSYRTHCWLERCWHCRIGRWLVSWSHS